MGYRLRVPAEIGGWLAGLTASEPAVAIEVGASLIAVLDAAELPWPPLAGPAYADAQPPGDGDPRALVDAAYQDLRGELQVIRRHAANASRARNRAELHVTELTGQAGAHPDEIATAVRRAAAARRRDDHLARISQDAQAEVARFRALTDAAKAGYTAATGTAEVLAATAAAGDARQADADLAAARAAQRIQDALAGARAARRWMRGLQSEYGGRGAGPAPESGRREDAGLFRLLADPLGADIRILFALDPPGTVTLLSVLEGAAAIAEHGDAAVDAAARLLAVIKDEGWPPYPGEPGGGGQEFADAGQFRREFYAASEDAVAARARAIAARGTLASLRERAGMGVPEIAALTGLTEQRVAAIERGDLRHATLHELTVYLRAVGATLDLAGTLDGENVRLA